MLPKTKRLTTKSVDLVMEKGRMTHSPLFVIRSISTQETSRFSVSVPKKVAKTAVERNKIRRQVYSGIKKIEHSIKSGLSGMIVVKAGAQKLSFESLISEIKSTFVKSGFLK
ncbi:MAG: Ribonuclease protein component [Patescibacteria group bacterium]|nr:Ribonuclease protein component [Patescibacteria group bacterium]